MTEIFFDVEEEYKGYVIFIERNPDPYRGGFSWSVCNDGEEIDVGLDFSVENARKEAQGVIDTL